MFHNSQLSTLNSHLSTLLAVGLVALVVFQSCQKASLSENDSSDSDPVTDANLVVVVTNKGLTSTRLNFAIYDIGGTRQKQVNQQSSAADFGSAAFQLEEGTYQLVVVGHNANGNPTMTNPAKIQFKNNQGFTDTFIHYDTITIGDEIQTLRVSLDRIVSMCRFVINDSIPDDISQMKFYYTGGSGAFDAATGLGSVNSKQEMKFGVTPGHTWTAFDLYTFLHQQRETIHLTVTALDDSGSEHSKREFDVPMQQNQITWFTGTFFHSQSRADKWTIIPKADINTTWLYESYYRY